MKLALFLPSLDAGGAQRQFLQLAAGLARRGHDVLVITLVPGGRYWEEMNSAPGVRLLSLRRRRRGERLGLGPWLAPLAVRLHRLLDRERPDVLYSALHIANLLAWLATLGGRMLPLVWGVRASAQDLPWRRRLPFECCRILSGSVDLVIANAQSGLDAYAAVGYAGRNASVIANGIDTDALHPSRGLGETLRNEWGIPTGALLVGVVGRLTPVKGHETLLAAAARLVSGPVTVRFVCVGDGNAAERDRLGRLAVEMGLEGHVVWAGERRDMLQVYNALDLLCLPSRSEAFPNVVAEAMACGVACVVTDVGDAAQIVGNTGAVVPADNASALASALAEQLSQPEATRRAAGVRCRQRVVALYGLECMLAATEHLLEELALSRRRRARLPRSSAGQAT